MKIDAETKRILKEIQDNPSRADRQALADGYYFDEQAAIKPILFAERYCKLSKSKWAGKPIKLMPFQKKRFANIYGWKKPNGYRRYSHCFITEAKKNGKTTESAVVGSYGLVADNEKGAQVYSVANDIDQAKLSWREAANMVETSPELSKRLTVRRSRNTIFNGPNAFFKALAADTSNKDGFDISLCIGDEVHEWRDRELMEKLEYGGIARTQPLFYWISTAGYDKTSLFYEMYEEAKRLLDQNGDYYVPHLYAEIHEVGIDEDWTDESLWQKANPALGYILDLDDLRNNFQQALEQPTKENSFRRYRLNQWTSQEVRAIPMVQWDACGGDVDEEALAGMKCYGGLDLSKSIDLCALVYAFPVDDKYKILPRFFLPKERLDELERADKVPYAAWEKQEYLHTTPGRVIQYDFIEAQIRRDADKFDIKEFAFDPWNSTQFTQGLENIGFPTIPYRQTFGMLSPPMKELLALVQEEQIEHGGHPILRWCADNVVTETNANDDIKPSKKKSTQKIDGIVALIMALDRAMRHEEIVVVKPKITFF